MTKKRGNLNMLDIARQASGGHEDDVFRKLAETHDSEFAMAMQDIWYFAQFVKTFDEENEKIRKFPQYQYLKDFNDDIEKHQRVIVLKARRMLMSWVAMLRQLWRAMRASTGVEGCGEVFGGGVMTVGEVEGIHLMDRAKSMYEGLPEWMKARNPMVMANMLEIRFRAGGKIRAFPLKREGPRTFGFTEVVFDEMAFQEAARTVWMGMIPTLGASGKVVAISTPNGRHNLFHEIWANKDHLYDDVHRIWLSHDKNPEHNNAWLKKATRGLDKQMIAREFHGSFAALVGSPVWSEFDTKMHVWDVDNTPMEIEEGVPVYIGWDLGYHSPAAVIAQRNSRDQWLFFREILGEDVDFDSFCDKVLQICNSLYDRKKTPEIHCMPPDARFRYNAKSRSGAANDIGQVKITFRSNRGEPQVRFCPGEVGTRENEAPRLKQMRKAWKLREDGRPGALVNPSMEFFIEGCQSGYCYPEGKESEQPHKNEYSHVQDACQAIVAAYAQMVKPSSNKVSTKKRPRIILRSGRR